MDQGKRKILAGGRVRKLRTELGLSQSAMAQELGISISYLNLVERNQRPLTAQLLIKLSENYAIDLKSFAEEEEARAVRDLDDIFSDPMFENFSIAKQDIRSLAEHSPALLPVIRHLYDSYSEAREFASKGGGFDQERGELKGLSRSTEILERTRQFLQSNNNHFPQLETAAEQLHAELMLSERPIFVAMLDRLRDKHGIRVQVMKKEEIGDTLRHFDRHRRKLMLSERLEPSGRMFQAAYQLALQECHEVLDSECARLTSGIPDAARLGMVALANYLAAAIVMPYGAFFEAAETLAYDVDALCSRFEASFEQVAHRLTTLARPSARGVTFFMIRVDQAGNISKRFSSGTFPFSRIGGTCPRWNIHSTFRHPGRINTQRVEIEGKTWLSIARTVRRVSTSWGEHDALFSVGLGCEARFADRLIYFRDSNSKLAKATEIGVNCRLCDRPNCLERSTPHIGDKLQVSENTRGLSPFGG